MKNEEQRRFCHNNMNIQIKSENSLQDEIFLVEYEKSINKWLNNPLKMEDVYT
jgi:hypothetical protein